MSQLDNWVISLSSAIFLSIPTLGCPMSASHIADRYLQVASGYWLSITALHEP